VDNSAEDKILIPSAADSAQKRATGLDYKKYDIRMMT
jgi:hypothetical protein